jgi:tRNA-dihydrouridine synthase
MKQPFFILAPMDDVTDVVFRSVVADCAPPDMFFTEFVNVDGLCSRGRPKLLHKLAIDPKSDHYIVGQIWGKNPDNYRTVANELVEMGFHGVDINMGCPQKNEVKNGCCSALINDRDLAKKIIQATKEGVDGRIPVSVKTRLGWNEIDLSWHEFLLVQDIDMLSVHMRTRKEMSDVPAHWDVLPEIIALRDRISPHTKIVMNGDIMSRPQGLELAEKYGADGIMIGRGIFHDLCAFADNSPWATMTPAQRISLYRKHIDRFDKQYQARERNFQTLRRYCKVYINGLPRASELREQLMACQSSTEMIAVLDNYAE